MYADKPLSKVVFLKVVRRNLLRWTAVLVALFSIGLVHYLLHPPHYGGWKQVVVAPGQTLWDLCLSNCPKANTRDVVDAAMQYNHIESALNLQPGETLWVPTSAH